MKPELATTLLLFSCLTISACGQDNAPRADAGSEKKAAKTDKDTARRAYATIEINKETGRFSLIDASSENGGNEAHITNLANGAAADMNKILDDIVGENAVADVLNPEDLRLTFGHEDLVVYYETPEGRTTTSAEADTEKKAYNDAVIKTIRKAEVSGGNLYVKRVLLNSKTLDKLKFNKDVAIGGDMEKYRQNKPIIDAALKRPSKSKFALGWEKSLELAKSDGILRASKSDFYGGAEGFVRSALRNQPKRRIGPVDELAYVDFEIDGRDLKVTIEETARVKRSKQSGDVFTLTGFLNPKGDPSGWTGYSRAPNSARGYARFTGPAENGSARSNDIYIGNETRNTISGSPGNDWIDGGSGADKIKGGDGDDVLIAGAGNDIMSGGKGDDSLYAGAGNNEISGDLGNDRLIFSSQGGLTKAFGGRGDDTFFIQKITTDDTKTQLADGGDGTDTVSFETYDEGIDLELQGGDRIVSLPGQELKLENIENLSGSYYSDSLTGDDRPNTLNGLGGNDKLNGKKGDDVLEGGGGADTFTGGDGTDTVSYAGSYGGVDVSLEYENPHAFGGDASGDRFEDDLENLTGSGFADVLEGNRGDNVIESGRGDDYIIATNGSDKYVGGEGFDTVDYGNHKGNSGLTLNADKPITGYIDGFSDPAGQHILTGIDHLVGTPYADIITFGKGNQVLEAGKGDDTLTGGDGDDTYFVEITGGHDEIFEKGSEGRDILMIGYEKDLSWNDISFSIKDRTLKVFHKDTLIASAVNGPYKGATFQDLGIEVLDLGGAGQVEINALELEAKGAAPTGEDDTIKGHNGVSNLLIGLDGNDEIWGGSSATRTSDKGNLFHGGRGNDKIFSGDGDDRYIFDRGSGFDTITDFGGKDQIYFGPQVQKEDLIFETVGADLFIGIKPGNTRRDDVLSAGEMQDKIKVVNGAKSRASAIETYTVQNKTYKIP